MKSSANLLEELKVLPYFSKDSVQQMGMQLGLRSATVDTYISRFLKRRQLYRLKNGLYVSREFFQKHRNDISYAFYRANILRMPSYVSSWAALQYYDLTTEIIRTITSVTPKVTRTYQTKTGTFAYQSINKELFTGFSCVKGAFDFFIASPAKALFDMLYFRTRQFRGMSTDNSMALIRELRIDFEDMEASEQEKFHALITPFAMSEQLVSVLKSRLDEITDQSDPDVRRNALKEVLQLHILNFLYHHPVYSTWVMYGGSALRILHGLDRMSVDLDFEVPHPITENFLRSLKEEIEHHFVNTYNAGADFLDIKITNTRGVALKFHIESLHLGHPSQQVHVKIDLNHFTAPKTVTERRPMNQGQLSFVILTYNMSALMASKIAAIFLRGTRGVGGVLYEEKGRDIYDLLWYMERNVVPDFKYLTAKGVDVRDPRTLFDRLTVQMNDVSDENLKQDLFPLFMNRSFIEHWVGNWRESYLRYLAEYTIRTITELGSILIDNDSLTGNSAFVFLYGTEDGGCARIVCTVSEDWMDFREWDLPIDIDEHLTDKIKLSGHRSSGSMPLERLKKYVTLFYQKIEAYLKNTNRVMLGGQIMTKVIRMTADNFNPREQILLNPSALISCGLEDLLK